MHAATGNRYADGNNIGLCNLGQIALISIYQLSTSNAIHLEDNSHAHIVFLMFKLVTSARNTDGLSIGFDRNRDRRQQDLTKNKTQKGKIHVKISLKDKFGFVENQQKATYDLGYKLTLTSNTDNALLKKENPTIIGKCETIL